MTTEHPAIQRADLQQKWLAANPAPDMNRATSDQIAAWARRWRNSPEYRECVALTEQINAEHHVIAQKGPATPVSASDRPTTAETAPLAS